MKIRISVLLILCSLLMNNIALAGVLWLDQCQAVTGLPDSVIHSSEHGGAGDRGHKDHATHCCHLQAHFQTVVVQAEVLSPAVSHGDWRLASHDRLNSHISSPPNPPPKA